MARRQVIVQLDDEITAHLDEIAEREGVSRSELVRRAASALIESYRVHEQERRQIESYRERPQDPVIVETARRLAARTLADG